MEQPPWLAEAWAELGQREVQGSADNARITAFFRESGQATQLHDEVAWCAAFVGACLERAGCTSTRSLMARSYVRWGEPLEEGRFGAVAVLSRGSDPDAGHVGFLIGEAGGQIYLLGGNQGDAVTVAAFPRARVIGLRWPPAHPEVAPVRDAEPDGDLFARALDHVLEMEGGFSDDPYDPGGPTNRGITLAVYADWKGVSADADLKDELRHIPDAEVRAIYVARYWQPAGCAELVPALAFFHFDTAVNHGVAGAIRLLQQAVGTDADGEIGPLTLSAIARRAIEETLDAYAEVRRARYRALPHFWRFGRGWLKRVDTTLARARAIAAPSAPSSPTQQKGPTEMPTTSTSATPTPTTKWWGSSVTIWGALLTALSTVLPALGPIIGIDVTADLVQEVGGHLVETVQAVGGLIGTLMTIYGRVRASQPLAQREMTMKL
jgi:uncharacterized protein (TIGR02594 family)